MSKKDANKSETRIIENMGRAELKRQIRGFRGRFKLDFAEDYLDSLTVDRLRHILLAALVNAKKS